VSRADFGELPPLVRRFRQFSRRDWRVGAERPVLIMSAFFVCRFLLRIFIEKLQRQTPLITEQETSRDPEKFIEVN
jgi:hypothetical protein